MTDGRAHWETCWEVHHDCARKLLVQTRSDLDAIKDALLGRDAEEGCCAPGEWCCYKSWSELAMDYADAIKELNELKAQLHAAGSLKEMR